MYFEENKSLGVLFTKEEIAKRVKELGEEITKLYENSDKKLLIVTLLKGGVIFFSDFIREVNLKCNVEFIRASSYDGAESTGNVKIDFTNSLTNLSNYNVVIAEDIADTGVTLEKVYEYLLSLNPNTIKSVVLLDKPSRRKSNFIPDYTGFVIDDLFVIGYGLDYCESYRNLPYIAVLSD